MTLTTRHPDLSPPRSACRAPRQRLPAADEPHQRELDGAGGGQAQQVAARTGLRARATQEIRWHGHNPTDLADNLRDVVLQVRRSTARRTHCSRTTTPRASSAARRRNEIHRDSVSFHDRLVAADIPHLWKDYGAAVTGSRVPARVRRLAARHQSVFEHPQPAPKTISYESIEPRFSVWGWHVVADPSRARVPAPGPRRAPRPDARRLGHDTVTTPPFLPARRRGRRGHLRRNRSVSPDATGA